MKSLSVLVMTTLGTQKGNEMATIERSDGVKELATVRRGKAVFALECECTNHTEFKGGQWYRDGMLIEVPNIGVDKRGYKACCKKCGNAPWIVLPIRT